MSRIPYDAQTAAAFKAVREVPRDGLGHWQDAIRRAREHGYVEPMVQASHIADNSRPRGRPGVASRLETIRPAAVPN